MLARGSSSSEMPESDRSLDSLEIGRADETLCLLARFFGGFADPTRLSLLLLLARRGESRVGELVEELDVPQPRVSDHLGYLAGFGYVRVRRAGRYAYYSVADERVMQMLYLGGSLARREGGLEGGNSRAF